MSVSCKDWIQSRVGGLALELYDKEFYDLSDSLRDEVYFKAEVQYRDFCLTRIDAIRERIKEGKL